MGLSPRVRGSLYLCPQLALGPRSIPAGAGEPPRRSLLSMVCTVYPRGCGGASTIEADTTGVRGLSPRVRGSQTMGGVALAYLRSIPAGAGEPGQMVIKPSPCRVYPRGCGGAFSAGLTVREAGGLSPRVRGSRALGRCSGPGSRSIPAGAGEPRPRPRPRAPGSVYPRGCGGATPGQRQAATPRGLSPRVRGSRHDQVADLGLGGSIPAGAGEPTGWRRPQTNGGVYPRGCGGALGQRRDRRAGPGLSPRVRGSPGRSGPGAAGCGSIPAGAGEPL